MLDMTQLLSRLNAIQTLLASPDLDDDARTICETMKDAIVQAILEHHKENNDAKLRGEQ